MKVNVAAKAPGLALCVVADAAGAAERTVNSTNAAMSARPASVILLSSPNMLLLGSIGFGDSEEERQLRGKAAAALERYYQRFQSEEAEPMWFERPFTFRLGPHLLRGRVPGGPPAGRGV